MKEQTAIKGKGYIGARLFHFQLLVNSNLQVHGLLHLLGFDHEISDEAEEEMEKEEELLLKSLGWKGKGLIQCAYDAETNDHSHSENPDGNSTI